jgi:hypothetical protein
MTTHIEMAGIRTIESLWIFNRCWLALDAAGIPFACHWSQQGGHTPLRLWRYFGVNAFKWGLVRKAILTMAAREVFASKILASAGLD